MKNLLFCILFLNSMNLFSQSTIEFVKQIQPDTYEYTLSDINCGVIVQNYDGELIKISVKVEANVSEESLLTLFKLGRYNISVKNGGIMFDRIKKTIFINGIELDEIVTIDITLPYGINLRERILN